MPVVIDICSRILYKEKKPEKECIADHAVIAAGMRSNPKTKKCEILIRNSWGTHCDTYSSEWTCNSDGSVWEEELQLKNAVLALL